MTVHVDKAGMVHAATRWPGGWMIECSREVLGTREVTDDIPLTCVACIGLKSLLDDKERR